MSRYGLNPIMPPSTGVKFTGAALASQFNSLAAAVASGHYHEEPPVGVEKGLFWCKKSGTEIHLMLFNGTDHVQIGVWKSTGGFTLTNHWRLDQPMAHSINSGTFAATFAKTNSGGNGRILSLSGTATGAQLNFKKPNGTQWNIGLRGSDQFLTFNHGGSDANSGTDSFLFDSNGNFYSELIGGWASDAIPHNIGSGIAGASNINFYRTAATGGRMGMWSSHQVLFHWGNGLYYNVDNQPWVLINSSPSDIRFKNILPYKDNPFDFIKKLNVIRYEAKNDTPVDMPKGARIGFSAQELRELDPALVEEKPIPFTAEYKMDKKGNLVVDKNGETIQLPHKLDNETYLALAQDAPIILIAHLARAMEEVVRRSEKNDGDGPVTDESIAPTLESIRAKGLKFIDDQHSKIITRATGGGSIADRDTWPEQSSAAFAMIKGTADWTQVAMLALYTFGGKIDFEYKVENANTINARYAGDKAVLGYAKKVVDAVIRTRFLIGFAGGFKNQAKLMVLAATEKGTVSDAEKALRVISEQLLGEVGKVLG